MKHLKNLRKIVVGDNYQHCIKYIVGKYYNLGESQGKITAIIQSEEDPKLLDMYVKIDGETVYWKSVKISKCLDFENDVNFE